MGVLSNELSSWRKNIIECTSHNVTTLNFRDTRPNVMLVMNPTESEILCNLDSIPTEKHYDFRIKNHYARLVGKPVATSQVYFLNNSEENVTLQVYSIYDKNFDPSWLTDFSIENVNLGSESIQPIIDAIKNTPVKYGGLATGIPYVSVRDERLNASIDKLLSPNTANSTTNLYSLLLVLDRVVSGKNLEGYSNFSTIIAKLESIFNKDCAVDGTSFGAVLLNNEEPSGDNRLLGLYNVIQKLDEISKKLDTLIAK